MDPTPRPNQAFWIRLYVSPRMSAGFTPVSLRIVRLRRCKTCDDVTSHDDVGGNVGGTTSAITTSRLKLLRQTTHIYFDLIIIFFVIDLIFEITRDHMLPRVKIIIIIIILVIIIIIIVIIMLMKRKLHSAVHHAVHGTVPQLCSVPEFLGSE